MKLLFLLFLHGCYRTAWAASVLETRSRTRHGNDNEARLIIAADPFFSDTRSLRFFYNQHYRIEDLWEAIDEQDSDRFEEVLRCSCVHLDARDDYGQSALLKALDAQNETMAIALVDAGADVNVKNNRQFTPLHRSCRYGFMNVTRLMLERGADVNAETRSRERPIIYAASLSSTQMLELLISYGAELNFVDVQGETPLHEAAMYGNIENSRYLIERGASLTVQRNDGQTPAESICACLEHDERELIPCERGICNETDIRELKALFRRAERRGNAVSNDGVTNLDLWTAVARGTPKDVEQVLDCNCTHPDTEDRNSNCRCVELQAVTQVETRHWERGQTALHLAVLRKHLSICRLLIKNGARADFRNGDGDTPLHLATRDNSIQIVELFLAQGISADGQNNEGQTALHVASRYGFLNVTRLLVDYGAALNVNDEQGAIPVEIVCSCLLLRDCSQGSCRDADDIVSLMTALTEEDEENQQRVVQLFFPSNGATNSLRETDLREEKNGTPSLGAFISTLYVCAFAFCAAFIIAAYISQRRQAWQKKQVTRSLGANHPGPSCSHDSPNP